MPPCGAKTRHGKPCTRSAAIGKIFCTQHAKSSGQLAGAPPANPSAPGERRVSSGGESGSAPAAPPGTPPQAHGSAAAADDTLIRDELLYLLHAFDPATASGQCAFNYVAQAYGSDARAEPSWGQAGHAAQVERLALQGARYCAHAPVSLRPSLAPVTVCSAAREFAMRNPAPAAPAAPLAGRPRPPPAAFSAWASEFRPGVSPPRSVVEPLDDFLVPPVAAPRSRLPPPGTVALGPAASDRTFRPAKLHHRPVTFATVEECVLVVSEEIKSRLSPDQREPAAYLDILAIIMRIALQYGQPVALACFREASERRASSGFFPLADLQRVLTHGPHGFTEVRALPFVHAVSGAAARRAAPGPPRGERFCELHGPCAHDTKDCKARAAQTGPATHAAAHSAAHPAAPRGPAQRLTRRR